VVDEAVSDETPETAAQHDRREREQERPPARHVRVHDEVVIPLARLRRLHPRESIGGVETAL